ncbi:MAG: hypothetical protein WC294_06050 [Methanoregula sp.]|jgi:hypothetical protein
MRARNIKPGFFINEDLAECDPLARLLFAGLWCLADRMGRLEYRPKRIKAAILPYDNCNCEKLLTQLGQKGFITIYSVEKEIFIEINKFTTHQNCHIKEAESTIQAPGSHGAKIILAGPLTDSLLLIPDSPILKHGGATPMQKVKYLDSVFLTDPEHKKLQEAMGQKSLDVGIEKLDYSITVKGGKYKDHYKTILNWFKRGYLNGNGTGTDRGKQTAIGKAKSDGADYPVDAECTE